MGIIISNVDKLFLNKFVQIGDGELVRNDRFGDRVLNIDFAGSHGISQCLLSRFAHEYHGAVGASKCITCPCGLLYFATFGYFNLSYIILCIIMFIVSFVLFIVYNDGIVWSISDNTFDRMLIFIVYTYVIC